MAKQLVPRTAVKPNGGIYRVERPVETDAGEWLKNNQHIARFLGINEVRDMFPTTWEGIGKLIVAVPVEEAQQRLSEALEMKQEIVQQYFPHNCEQKDNRNAH